MRVNARLDEGAQADLEFLTQATGGTVSDVVREALAVYQRKVRQSRPRASKFLALAGTGDSGRSDISSNYKKYVAEAIEAKFARSHLPPPKPAVKRRKAPVVK